MPSKSTIAISIYYIAVLLEVLFFLLTSGFDILGVHIPVIAGIVASFLTDPADQFSFPLMIYLVMIFGPAIIIYYDKTDKG